MAAVGGLRSTKPHDQPKPLHKNNPITGSYLQSFNNVWDTPSGTIHKGSLSSELSIAQSQ